MNDEFKEFLFYINNSNLSKEEKDIKIRNYNKSENTKIDAKLWNMARKREEAEFKQWVEKASTEDLKKEYTAYMQSNSKYIWKNRNNSEALKVTTIYERRAEYINYVLQRRK